MWRVSTPHEEEQGEDKNAAAVLGLLSVVAETEIYSTKNRCSLTHSDVCYYKT